MKKIGFIGAGNMATAIIKGLSAQNYDGGYINVFDVSKEMLDKISVLGVNTLDCSQEVVKQSDITVPAGISTGYVQNALGCDCPVMRVMPNTPLLLKKGATALCPSDNLSEDDRKIIYDMFSGSGVCEYITEEHMNEVIAVNGSSPAYIYLFAKAMADYAVSVGIEYDKAMSLICATLEGSAAMLRESGDSPDILIQKVSSKGGTTIEALNKLREHGFTEAVTDAMKACTDRAEELGK